MNKKKLIILSITILSITFITKYHYNGLNPKRFNSDKALISICSHDYVPIDCILTWYNVVYKMGIRDYNVIVANGYNPPFQFPGINIITRDDINENKIIDILQNKGKLAIFYQRGHIKFQNLHKLIKRCDFNIIPITITTKNLPQVSHNNTNLLFWLKTIITNRFKYKIYDEIECNKDWDKNKFIELISNTLYNGEIPLES